MQAFMAGKMKVKGNMMLAQKFASERSPDPAPSPSCDETSPSL